MALCERMDESSSKKKNTKDIKRLMIRSFTSYQAGRLMRMTNQKKSEHSYSTVADTRTQKILNREIENDSAHIHITKAFEVGLGVRHGEGHGPATHQ